MSQKKNFVNELIKDNLLHTHPVMEAVVSEEKPWQNAVIVDEEDYEFIKLQFANVELKLQNGVPCKSPGHIWIPADVREELLDLVWTFTNERGSIPISEHPNLKAKLQAAAIFEEGCPSGKCDQLYVTGSISLAIQGLYNPRNIEDVDIVVVNPDQVLMDYVKMVVKLSPAEDKDPGYNTDPKKPVTFYKFMVHGQLVNLFVLTQPEMDVYSYGNYNFGFASVRGIVSMKKGYKRLKDREHLMEVASIFYNESDDHTIYATAIEKLEKKEKEAEEKMLKAFDDLANAYGCIISIVKP